MEVCVNGKRFLLWPPNLLLLMLCFLVIDLCAILSSYSRLLAFEASRILFRLGCDVRIYDPAGLPVKDDVNHSHHKVQELRDLSRWSDGHVWVSAEQHGNLVSPPCRPVSAYT